MEKPLKTSYNVIIFAGYINYFEMNTMGKTIFNHKHLLVLIAICLLSQSAWSQSRRIINYTEIGALIHNSTSLNDNSKFNGFRTRTGISKLLDDHIALGFALGTDNYKKASGGNYNTLPITLNTSWYMNSDLSGLKADIYGGYAVKLFSNLNRGLTGGVGLSYSFPLNSGMNLGLQTGYNYQKIDFPSSFTFDNNFDIGSIRLGLGITFK